MGFDLELFSNKSEASKFLCVVCQAVARNVSESPCGHIFCRVCISRLVRLSDDGSEDGSGAQCPSCREGITPDLCRMSGFLDRLVGELQCECPDCKGGWKGPLSALDKHRQSECTARLVPCDFAAFGCAAEVRLCDMDTHLREEETAHLRMHVRWLQNELHSLKKAHQREVQELKKDWQRRLIDLHRQSQDHRIQDSSLSLNHTKRRKTGNITNDRSLSKHHILIDDDDEDGGEYDHHYRSPKKNSIIDDIPHSENESKEDSSVGRGTRASSSSLSSSHSTSTPVSSVKKRRLSRFESSSDSSGSLSRNSSSSSSGDTDESIAADPNRSPVGKNAYRRGHRPSLDSSLGTLSTLALTSDSTVQSTSSEKRRKRSRPEAMSTDRSRKSGLRRTKSKNGSGRKK